MIAVLLSPVKCLCLYMTLPCWQYRYENHSNPEFPGPLRGVRLQLDALQDKHVGYTSKHFCASRHPALTVVGGRPFSHVRLLTVSCDAMHV